MTKYYKHNKYEFIYKVKKPHYITYDLLRKSADTYIFGEYTWDFQDLDAIWEITKSEFDGILLWNLMGSHIENITMKSKMIDVF